MQGRRAAKQSELREQADAAFATSQMLTSALRLIALALRGVARVTEDVDALLETLSRHDIVPRIPDATAFARERQVLLLRHEPGHTPMELSLAWLPTCTAYTIFARNG